MAGRVSRRLIADYVAKKLIAGDNNIITGLAALLVEERRTSELDLIVRDIEFALAESGVVIADVTSARPLSDELRTAIASFIKKESGATDVTLREQIEADVIGGVKVEIPGAEYDATIENRLEKLRLLKV